MNDTETKSIESHTIKPKRGGEYRLSNNIAQHTWTQKEILIRSLRPRIYFVVRLEFGVISSTCMKVMQGMG